MPLNNIQHKIYDFLARANHVLGDEHALMYYGQFASGHLQNPDILFISINPGHYWKNKEGKTWADRHKHFEYADFNPVPCKYIEEYEDNVPLASRIFNVLLDKRIERLDSCAETYITSIFNTPDTEVLYASLNKLGRLAPELRKEHDELSQEIISYINPKHIVCIGMTAFNAYLSRFGKNGYAEVQQKDARSLSGKTSPVYLKKTVVNGIPVYGIIHLSGAHPSNAALDGLRQEFKTLFTSLEK